MRKIKFFLNDSKLAVRFILPSMFSMLTAGLYTLVDGFFVGWGTGSLGIAALNVAYPLALLLVALGEMIGIGGAINISLARGRGYHRSANQALGTMLRLIIPAAILMPMILIPVLKPLLRVIGAADELLPAAYEYAVIIIGGGFFQMMTVSLLEAMRNDNVPVKAMLILVAGLGANIVLDYLFVIVFSFGVAGSAWATILAQACSMILAIIYFLRGNTELSLMLRGWKLRRKLLTRILLSGIPSFGVQLSIGAVILLHNTQALRYGGVSGVAAYAVISYVEAAILLMIQGIALGIQPAVSYLQGAGKILRRKRMAGYGLLIAFVFGTGAMLVSLSGSQWIPRIFHAEGEVFLFAAAGLLLSSPLYPMIGIQKVSESYFQSMGRFGAASLLIYLDCCVILPLCLLVLPLSFGLNGVWAAMPVTKALMLIAAGLLWSRVRRQDKAPDSLRKPEISEDFA